MKRVRENSSGKFADSARAKTDKDNVTVETVEPIGMVLHCPVCGSQHVDAPEPESGWDNPPHKSHKCHFCPTVWRPADVPTYGVSRLKTKGKDDTWTPDGLISK